VEGVLLIGGLLGVFTAVVALIALGTAGKAFARRRATKPGERAGRNNGRRF
jgi:hypothetical protein